MSYHKDDVCFPILKPGMMLENGYLCFLIIDLYPKIIGSSSDPMDRFVSLWNLTSNTQHCITADDIGYDKKYTIVEHG